MFDNSFLQIPSLISSIIINTKTTGVKLMIIYADELFVINALSDFLLLCTYTFLYGVKRSYIRIIASSVSCGLYSVFEAVYDIHYVFRIPVLFLMVLIAWGRIRFITNTLKLMTIIVCIQGITVFVLSAVSIDASLVSGTLNVFANGTELFVIYIISYPVMLLVKHIVIKKNRIRHIYVEFNGRNALFDALYDSGNLLRYHNKPVIVAQWSAVCNVMEYDSYDEYYKNAQDYVLYKTIGRNGVIPVFEPNICRIDGEIHEVEIAIVNYGFGKRYNAIVGNTN